MDCPYQRNNSSIIINEDIREPPTNVLKRATNSQIKINSRTRQEDKTPKYRTDNVKHLSLFLDIVFPIQPKI